MFSLFSNHTTTSLNRLYQLKNEYLEKGIPFTDLVSGNVSKMGMMFPEHLLQKALAFGISQSTHYSPHPLGQQVARKAVSDYYKEEGHTIEPTQIVMTPGTSLAYLYLFKLLANPGDEFLCPSPSYPLFDSIADFCNVTLKSYPLKQGAYRWELPIEPLEKLISPKTKGIVLISPHNPTGMIASTQELQALAGVAQRYNVPIISDEVFSPFLFQSSHLPRPLETNAPLVFTLNGISKMLALPGMKLGWIVISGDEHLVQKAVQGLDFISDLFLPVNEAAQFALPTLLQESDLFQTRFRGWVKQKWEELVLSYRRKPVSIPWTPAFAGVTALPEGGFYVTVETSKDADQLAYELLKEKKLLVHPGHFYDLGDHQLVFSFLGEGAAIQQVLLDVE